VIFPQNIIEMSAIFHYLHSVRVIRSAALAKVLAGLRPIARTGAAIVHAGRTERHIEESKMMKKRRIEITAFRRRRLALIGNNPDTKFSARSQSSNPPSSNAGSLLSEDTNISADVARLLKRISRPLEDQSEDNDEGQDRPPALAAAHFDSQKGRKL
jgi:hypothetical protein